MRPLRKRTRGGKPRKQISRTGFKPVRFIDPNITASAQTPLQRQHAGSRLSLDLKRLIHRIFSLNYGLPVRFFRDQGLDPLQNYVVGCWALLPRGHYLEKHVDNALCSALAHGLATLSIYMEWLNSETHSTPEGTVLLL